MTKNEITRKLDAMFRDAPENALNHLALYEEAGLLPVRPWWPPLSEVWLNQGECPPDAGAAMRSSWPEAWAYLQTLHAEWCAANGT